MLSGLSVGFQSGPVKIDGGLMRHDTGGVTQYLGSASIGINNVNISAIGAYSTYKGHPSLFIFAYLTSPPLGGPPAFYVTGVAAGFGYNRALKLPGIDGVAQFPLTKGFVPGQKSDFKNADLNAAMDILTDKEHDGKNNVIPPEIGQYWLAAGVQFNTFKQLQSYALLSVQFGTKLEIGLLGMSTLTIPPKDPKDAKNMPTLAKAQLALLARILPDEGLIAVDGKLTQESYVLSTSCRLVGGFAFYVWTAPSEHAGDFVVTLGGYHPNFNVPAHYPKVPRLGFNWVVTSEVTIKGEMYFALVPSCLMAGGSLQAVFQSGDLKAWFTIAADFIIAWKPFRYTAALYVNFGVSYSFNLDLLFTSVRVTISVSLGADLTVWGPDFSGVAHIHLWIISFTISFGNSPNTVVEPITWKEFTSTFMPVEQPKALLARQLKALQGGTPTEVYCGSKIQRGLVEDVSGKKDVQEHLDWIVNRNQVTLLTHSLIPSKGYSITIQDQDKKNYHTLADDGKEGSDPIHEKGGKAAVDMTVTNEGELQDWKKEIGVGMVKIGHDQFTSIHNVTIEYKGSFTREIGYQIKAVRGSVPSSLWSNVEASHTNATTIDKVLLGFEITPVAPKPDVTRPLPLKNFAFNQKPFNRTTLRPALPKPVDSSKLKGPAMEVMRKTIQEAAVTREQILKNLQNRHIDIDIEVSVEQLALHAQDHLLAPPVLAYGYWKKPSSSTII